MFSGQVVVGGTDFVGNLLSSVELFPRPLSDTCSIRECSIPDLPRPRKDHSISLLSGGRLVVCGGSDRRLEGSSYLKSCISWAAGATWWTSFHTMRCPPIGLTNPTPKIAPSVRPSSRPEDHKDPMRPKT